MFGRFTGLRKAAKVCRVRQLAIAFAAVVLFGGSFAHTADGPKLLPGTVNWGGLNWGIGIAVDFDIGQARVGDVKVVGPNNIVRVDNTTSNASVGFVLEAHYFLLDFIGKETMQKAVCGNTLTIYSCNEIGIGPFVAIEIGNGTDAPTSTSKGPVTGYALGLMVGLHHTKFTEKGLPTADRSSWNFGVGLRIDPNTQVLGDGIVANQPLPPFETTPVRLKHEPRLGVMLLSSFSF